MLFKWRSENRAKSARFKLYFALLHLFIRGICHYYYFAVALLICTAISISGPVSIAGAHGSGPLKIVSVHIGAYSLKVSFYDAEIHSAQPFSFSIDPANPVEDKGLTYLIKAELLDGSNSMVINVPVVPHPDLPGGVQGTFTPSVAGNWALKIDVNGARGEAAGKVPFEVIAPPPIPVWLGWAIGLIPMYGVLAYILMVGRRARRTVAGAGTSA